MQSYDSKFACIPNGTDDDSSIVAAIRHSDFKMPREEMERLSLLHVAKLIVVAFFIGLCSIPFIWPVN